MTAVVPERPVGGRLIDQFEYGLDAPICLTWELTYACNLACAHCLSSSGRRDPRELSTAEAEAVIDELQRMQVFYVNVGGGEPTVRPDFWPLLDYAVDHQVVNIEYEGGVTASVTVSAFTPMADRKTRLMGTRGYLETDGRTVYVYDFLTGTGESIEVDESGSDAARGHGGGDAGLVDAFLAALATADPDLITTGPAESLASHRVVWAAERARRDGVVVAL